MSISLPWRSIEGQCHPTLIFCQKIQAFMFLRMVFTAHAPPPPSPLVPVHHLKLLECRVRCETPKGSRRGGGKVVNFDLLHWPKTLSAFRRKNVITAQISGQIRRRPPAGTPSSSAASLNIITHIKSKHGGSGQLLSAPAVFTRGKTLQTCSPHLVCTGGNVTSVFALSWEQPLQHP